MSILTKYLRLSLFLTRLSLYGFSLFTGIVAILLPISIVTYLNFYKMLVPVERFAIPTNFKLSSSKLALDKVAFSAIDPPAAIDFLKRHADLLFSVRLNLKAVCHIEKSYHLIPYIFSLGSTSNYESSFLINCDSRYIYVDKNHWVPYHLRYWVPPILVNIFKNVDVDLPILYMKGNDLVKLLQSGASKFDLLDIFPILIDVSKTTLDFVIEWDGIRFYLVNYYFTSLFIGVLIFWSVSSFACCMSTVYFYNKFSDEEQTESTPKQQNISR